MKKKALIEFGGNSLGIRDYAKLLVTKDMEIEFYPTGSIETQVTNLDYFFPYIAGGVKGRMGDPSIITKIRAGTNGRQVKAILSRSNSGTLDDFVFEYRDSLPYPNPYHINGLDTLKRSYTDLTPNSTITDSSLQLFIEGETVVYVASDDPEVRFREIDGTPSSYYLPELTIPKKYGKTQHLLIRLQAPSSPKTTKNVNVYIGDTTVTFSLTTGAEIVPPNHLPISMGHTTGNIALSNIRSFFGGGNNLTDYFRGERNVPDMPTNSNIPTSVPISVADFRGAATAIYVSDHPSNRSDTAYVANVARTLGSVWNIWESDKLNSWDLGFSPFIRNNAEFRYEMTWERVSGYGNGYFPAPTVSGVVSNVGAWSSANRRVYVTVEAPRRSEFKVRVVVKFFARHRLHPNKVLTTSASYTVTSIGL